MNAENDPTPRKSDQFQQQSTNEVDQQQQPPQGANPDQSFGEVQAKSTTDNNQQP